MHVSIALVAFLSLLASSELCQNDREYFQQFLNKKYLLFYSEDNHFNRLLQAIGMSSVQRNMAIFEKPVLELKKIGDAYILSDTSANVNDVETFRLPDEWKTQTTWDGRTVSTFFCSVQSTLWQWEMGVDNVTIGWTFYPEEVRCNMFLRGGSQVKCLRVYRAMNMK